MAQEPPLLAPRPPEPAPPAPEAPQPRPPASYYASSRVGAGSALVHEQAAAFWGVQPFEEFLKNPLQWGPFQLRPFGSYRFTYGNGLNVTPGNQVTTALHEIAPGAVLQSQHLSFRYSPTIKYYSAEEFEDGVDHAASVGANFGVNDWTFSLGHSFSDTKSPMIETGAQTPQQTHSTVLSAAYQYSNKTSFEFSLSQSIQEADALNSSIGWSSMNWANYHWTEKTLIGLGVGGGYTKQDFGDDMTNEQLQGRIAWHPSAKLNLSLNGGVEFRQFVSSDLDDQVNPIFGASINYSPWEPTTFSLGANQSTGASLLEAQTTETISFNVGVRQRLLEVLHLGLFAGYQQLEYQGYAGTGSGGLQEDRTDEILSYSVDLGFTIFTKGEISLFYQRSENDSNAEEFSYDSDQYGFQLAYHF
ncbi:MAG TPA: outer membrane beta-barrel protein [Verrucomicrobiae bacterium]